MADLEATKRYRNKSSVDHEVALLDYQIVKAGEEADLPVYYAWHTDEEPAPVAWSPEVWEPVEAPKKSTKSSA